VPAHATGDVVHVSVLSLSYAGKAASEKKYILRWSLASQVTNTGSGCAAVSASTSDERTRSIDALTLDQGTWLMANVCWRFFLVQVRPALHPHCSGFNL